MKGDDCGSWFWLFESESDLIAERERERERRLSCPAFYCSVCLEKLVVPQFGKKLLVPQFGKKLVVPQFGKKLVVPQFGKKVPTLCGSRRLIKALKISRHWL